MTDRFILVDNFLPQGNFYDSSPVVNAIVGSSALRGHAPPLLSIPAATVTLGFLDQPLKARVCATATALNPGREKRSGSTSHVVTSVKVLVREPHHERYCLIALSSTYPSALRLVEGFRANCDTVS
jgi:hypothetical protein